MALFLDSLIKSVDALERSITVANGDLDLMGDDMIETIKAGVIQNFEVAYEQSWKMIQRWIKENKTPEDAENPRTRKELFRLAAKYHLINDPLPWFNYGEARNITSHTYDAEKATLVYENAQLFLGDAKYLIMQLEKMND